MDEIEEYIESEKAFVRERITQLRINANISEYQMSLELGQNKSYVQSISSGKAMPSMVGLFNICDYFGITPSEFFNADIKTPDILHKVQKSAESLSHKDLELLLILIERLKNPEV